MQDPLLFTTSSNCFAKFDAITLLICEYTLPQYLLSLSHVNESFHRSFRCAHKMWQRIEMEQDLDKLLHTLHHHLYSAANMSQNNAYLKIIIEKTDALARAQQLITLSTCTTASSTSTSSTASNDSNHVLEQQELTSKKLEYFLQYHKLRYDFTMACRDLTKSMTMSLPHTQHFTAQHELKPVLKNMSHTTVNITCLGDMHIVRLLRGAMQFNSI